MKHGKKVNHLGRKVAHRKSMLANMASSLIEHKRISTTVAKAKALKQFVEPLITKSKNDTTHNRRLAFSALRNKYAVAELFRAVAQKVGDRLGDNASMAMIELVDFNEVYNKEKSASKKSTRRSRSRSKVGSTENIPSSEGNQEQSTDNSSKETPAPTPKTKAKKTTKTDNIKKSESKKEGEI